MAREPRRLLVLPECTDCGSCCTGDGARHVPVRGEDWARLGDDAERWTVWIENRAFMRMEDGACAALAKTSGGGVECRVYARRPEVCRALERGGPACEAERARKPGWRR